MSADKFENQFDQILRQALQKHSEPVPPDFTDRMLSRIEQAQQREILARVILQERLALAGCIVFGVLLIAVVVVFPHIAASFRGQMGAFIERIGSAAARIGQSWQLYAVFLGMLGFALYSLVDLLVSDS